MVHFRAIAFLAALAIPLAASPIEERVNLDSVFNSVTSVVATGAGGVFTDVTQVGGAAVTIVTSAGGDAVTLGASGIDAASTFGGSVFTAATAGAGSIAASASGFIVSSTSTPNAGYATSPTSGAPVLSLIAVVSGVFLGAAMVV